jgi:hypothetical protein
MHETLYAEAKSKAYKREKSKIEERLSVPL